MSFGLRKSFIGMVAAIAMLASATAVQADLIWNNEVDNGLGGVLVTHPNGMSNGANRSALGVGGLLLGFGAQTINANRIADDFTLNSNYNVLTDIQLYAYQTGATSATINGATLRIWSGGAPGVGTVVWGDTTTNVLTGSSLSGIYRTPNAVNTDFNRQIQIIDIGGLNINLGAGTYWLDWNFSGTLTSGPWQPALTPPGATGLLTGNGLQSLVGGAYNPALDGGVPQDFPFAIFGVVPEPGVLSLLVLGGVFGVMKRCR